MTSLLLVPQGEVALPISANMPRHGTCKLPTSPLVNHHKHPHQLCRVTTITLYAGCKMSGPRLLFLYPHLFKPLCPKIDAQNVLRRLSRQPHSRPLSTSCRRRSVQTQRYGSATDPSLLPEVQEKINAPETPSKKVDAVSKSPAKPKIEKNAQPQGKILATVESSSDSPQLGVGPALDVTESSSETNPTQSSVGLSTVKDAEKVLHMEAPTGTKTEEHGFPNLHAAPYVHHFDTYTLVQQLEKSGFSMEQSVTIMKAVRSLLADNLDIAKEGLVSKADVENQIYLFRAACSELKTEIQNSRKKDSEKMRTERAHLQHEADILNQRVTQETLTLKDDLKGMLDDRKMNVRMEQRNMQSRIQELNYKITVALNSDSKGEVEGLRWFLTRRAAIFIASMACKFYHFAPYFPTLIIYLVLILGSLRYSSYMMHLQDQERKKMASMNLSSSGSGDGGSNFTTPPRSTSTQTGESETMSSSVDTEASSGYVSLG
jgi:hypothetical protein